MRKISPNDAMQARFRAAAEQNALAAVERHSDLRGEKASQVARHAVAAAIPDLRNMLAQKMGGTSAQEALASGLMFVAAATVDLAAYITLFRQGGRKTKTLAGTAIVLHAGGVAYARYKRYVIRQAARAELARLKTSEVKAA